MPVSKQWGVLLLRLGLAALFLWFGFSELANVNAWTIWVPAWALSLTGFSAHSIVLINGSVEVIAGLLLAVGYYSNIVAILLALHLFVIAFDIGLSDGIGVRDAALACATLAIALLPLDAFSLDARRSRTL